MQDLSQIKGTYTYELFMKQDKLRELFSEYVGNSLDTIKIGVLKIIEPATNNNSKQKFIEAINRAYDTTYLVKLVYDSILKVQGYGVI